MNYFDLIANNPELFAQTGMLRIITDPAEIADWQVKQRAKLIEAGKPEEWAEIGVILEDPYIVILRDLVEFPGGYRGGYVRLINRANLKGGQGVVILGLFQERLLLLHMYRHATRAWHFEVPRGFGEPGLLAADNARKELLEETGGEIAELVDLGVMHNNTGMEGNTTQLYFARLSSIGKPDEAEGIKSFRWVTLQEMEELIASGEITDGFTIAAFTRARLMKVI